jgi:hypothetical protein
MDGWVNAFVFNPMGMDIQSRTGMGDLLPWTNLANPTLSDKQQFSEFSSLFGASGGLGEKAFDATQLLMRGEEAAALKTALPRFMSSAATGYTMFKDGVAVDSKGRTLYNTTTREAFIKFFDGNPVRMAELSRYRGLEYKDMAIQKFKIDEARAKWIKAAMNDDIAEIEKIEMDIEKWNTSRPRYPIIFDRKRALAAANKNEMTWGERQKIPTGMEWMREQRPESE